MENTEKEKIKEFITEYQNINEDILILEKDIQKLIERKVNLLNKINYIKESEAKYLKYLKDKYGEDEITPTKILKYIQ